MCWGVVSGIVIEFGNEVWCVGYLFVGSVGYLWVVGVGCGCCYIVWSCSCRWRIGDDSDFVECGGIWWWFWFLVGD